MIFKPELVELILAGEKTMTRRPVKYGPWVEVSPGRDSRDVIPCRYKAGNTYAVQPGRGQKGVARIKVTAVCREPWEDIDNLDAFKEGFFAGESSCRDQFLTYVHDLYGPGFDEEAECWVIQFELVPAQANPGAAEGEAHSPESRASLSTEGGGHE